MEVFIDDVPEEGLTLNVTTDDQWFLEVVKEAIPDHFVKGDSAKLVVTLIKCEDNISITGEVTLRSHPNCDRCLKAYLEEKKIPFHVVMAPLFESERQRENESEVEKELVRDDMEFSYYEGDRIDMSDIVREQIVLDEPLKHLCSEDCKGICQHCGKNQGRFWFVAERVPLLISIGLLILAFLQFREAKQARLKAEALREDLRQQVLSVTRMFYLQAATRGNFVQRVAAAWQLILAELDKALVRALPDPTERTQFIKQLQELVPPEKK